MTELMDIIVPIKSTKQVDLYMAMVQKKLIDR